VWKKPASEYSEAGFFDPLCGRQGLYNFFKDIPDPVKKLERRVIQGKVLYEKTR
jgi:hypothetical protein